MDPISGMVTTIERPRTAPLPPKKDEQPKIQESRSSVDLSTRLAAVMAEKKKKNKEGLSEPSSVSTPLATAIIPETEATTTEGKESITEVKQEVPTRKIKQEVPAKEIKQKTPTREIIQEVPTKEIKQEAPPKEITEEIAAEEMDIEPSVQETPAQEVPKDIVEIEPPVEEIVKPMKQTDIIPEGKMTDSKKDTDTKQAELKTQLDVVTAPVKELKRENDTKDDKDRILEQRETQLLQAMENIAKLHDQIHQIQEDADTKLRSTLQQLENAQANTSSPANLTKTIKRLEASLDDLKKQMVSKEDKIQGLMLEGEKLSKVELRHSTLIKKLRLEKTEADKSLLDQTKKLEKAMADLSQASEKGTKQSETEKRLQDSVKLLSDLSEQQTKHINKLESEKISTTKKSSETELALKKALESMDDERTKAKLEAEQVNAAALEKEIKANDRLHKELTKTKQDAESLESKLRKEIRDLQIALQTVEEQGGLREDALRKEVADLQTKLQQSDNKMEDITTTVDEATAPLLRQIEELQTQHALAIKNRDQAEQRYITSILLYI